MRSPGRQAKASEQGRAARFVPGKIASRDA